MKHFLTFSLLLLTFGLFAQPANDDCPGLIDLGPAPICDSTLYNNVGATESNIGFDNFPGCFVGNPERDVWFSFVAVDTILDYRVQLFGCPDPALGLSSIVNPQIALYRGDCEFDGLQLLDCVSAANGETYVEIDLFGLTPGITYFLRINDWSPSATPNEGAFKLCVIKKPPVTTIDGGSSTACSGTLTDTGGEDGDYGNDENFVFSICPSTPSNCINFTLQYYNIESGDFFNPTDQLIFFDGPDTNSPQIGLIDGGNSNFASSGGVCYSVSASSGCLTIQFISDGTATYEGFLGTWECTAEECESPQAVDIDASASPEDIVQSVVAGQTVITVTNIDCAQGSVGTFNAGPDSELGLEQGLLLTSGSAPNVSNPGTFFTSGFNNTPGDDDLDYLSSINGNNSISNDACVVELDVFAATDEITFEYIFGSEEYPEWANTTFNDIFAFLVSGPGIVGDPNIGNQLNIATLPDGTFIQINSVNDGTNWEYYRDNQTGQTIAYDGLTSDSLGVKKSLTARVETIPCNTYHLKFAVADRGDSAFDSGVFISEIKGGSPQLGVNYQSGIEYLVEECTNIPDEIEISLNAPVNSPTTYDVIVGGNAQPGIDYTLNIPSTLTFNTGNEVFTFPIQALTDGIVEGVDTIEIQLVRDFGCGAVVLASLIIEIHDNLEVQIFDDELDTVLVCGGSCAQLEVNGGATYFWQPPGLLSDPNISNPIACPDSSQLVVVTGTLGICTDQDSVWLELITPEVEIIPGGPVTICATDTLVIEAVNNVNNSNLVWSSFFIPIPDPNDPVQTIIPPPFFNSIFLDVTVELGGCTATDNISINIDAFDFPQVAGDTTICQNYSVDLGEDIPNSTTTFSWTPNTGLTPGGNVSGPIATPEVTTTYTLIATSPTGVCVDTATVTIDVIPADVEILNADTSYICVGDSTTLNATNTTGGAGVTWSPNTFITQNSVDEVIVYPPVSTWYYVTLETAACTVIDSVLVYVDSLPDLSISAIPDKESYCQGEEITLVSPTYEPANFPGIELMWESPLPGAQTPDSFLNLVIIALDTAVYIRTTTVNACTSVDSITINVVPVASISIEPPQDSICQGESVDFTVIADPGVTDFTWSPSQGLSCTECPNPTASPTITTTYSVEGEFDGCPVGTSATVFVSVGPSYQFPPDTDVCPGEDITLNLFNDPNATYSWTSSDGSLTSNAAQPTVSPTQTTTYFLTAARGSCEIMAEVTITVPSDFTLTADPVELICPGSSVMLQANSSDPNVSYVWADEAGNEVGNSASVDVMPPVSTTYTVTATSAGGCFTNTASVTAEVAPQFMVTAGEDTTVSAGEEVLLIAQGTIAGLDYTWTDGTGMVIGTSDNVTVSSCGTEVYTVTATDQFGCTDSDNVNVTVTQGFTIDSIFVRKINTETDTLYEGEEFYLVVYTTPPVLPGATYEWYIADSLVATTTDTTSGTLNAFEILEDIPSQDAEINVVITSSVGCESQKNEQMTVFNIPVQIPNVFTPNGDRTNDNFTVISKVPVEIIEFKVWNRWGQIVYDNENGNDGWDGMQNEDPAPSDVYIYYVKWEIAGGSGRQYVNKGDVTLLR